MAPEKEIAAAFEAGRVAGVAWEHLRTLQQELLDLKGGQTNIVKKIDDLKEKLEQLNNWRWFVIGISSAIAFVISMVVGFLKGLFKP